MGQYSNAMNDLLGIDIAPQTIYRSTGLLIHMIKRKHNNCTQYIDCIPDIICSPDFIGVNPNENGPSVEFVKRYDTNVLVGVKLDTYNNYLYVSTMYEVSESKVKRRLHSGRLMEFVKCVDI